MNLMRQLMQVQIALFKRIKDDGLEDKAFEEELNHIRALIKGLGS